MSQVPVTRGRAPARRGRRFLFSLLVLVVLFHVAGGWYFSDQLRNDALTPAAFERNNGVRVLGVSESSITMSGTDRRGIEQPGQVGLWWEDGYALLGTREAIADDRVTRSFDLLEGTPPPICEIGVELDSCPPVDIEEWVYPSDPADVGLSFTEITYAAPIGELGAWLVPADDGSTDAWAIHLHGLGAERRETVRMLPIYASDGFVSMVTDYRNDEGAPEDPSGLYQFGVTEWEDAEAAVQYAIDQGAATIVLVGYSTGAGIEMSFLEQSDLAVNIDAMVFDAPNIDFSRAVDQSAKERSLPLVGLPIPQTLVWTAKTISGWRFDLDWEQIDYVERAADIITMPVLVFHGDNDRTVPVEVSEDLAAAVPGFVELIVTPTADHVQSWNVDRARYETELSDFLAAFR